jgi:hypothetical protein
MAFFNSNLLYDALNVTDITDLLDTVSGVKGLFDGRSVPDFFTADKTINFYITSPINGGLEWSEYIYSVNCRAKTDGESREIAQVVFNKLNRADFNGYHTNCNVLGTIPPINDIDNFNTPIEVILKSRL